MIGEHLARLELAARRLRRGLGQLDDWGTRLADVLSAGGRLLVCGNGGSAAQAQHLSAELVGRFKDERRPFSAIALHGDTSSLTAIVNDYGPEHAYSRQVRAHGRPGDVLICLSTSGRSPNVVAAARAAADMSLRPWALTGPGPNPLTEACTEALTVDCSDTATVQEIHLVAIHMLCIAVDARVRRTERQAS
jgi:D-sedoheptulose 7-phosphate isomerase